MADNGRLFSVIADQYGAHRISFSQTGMMDRFLQEADLVGKQLSVLDIAAGPGDVPRSLVAAGVDQRSRFVCVEPNDGMFSQLQYTARLGVAGGGADIQPVHSYVKDLPVGKASVDLVTMGNCAHYFNPATHREYYNGLQTEIARVLKPGGKIALLSVAPSPDCPMIRKIDALCQQFDGFQEDFHNGGGGFIKPESLRTQQLLPAFIDAKHAKTVSEVINRRYTLEDFIGYMATYPLCKSLTDGQGRVDKTSTQYQQLAQFFAENKDPQDGRLHVQLAASIAWGPTTARARAAETQPEAIRARREEGVSGQLQL